MPDNSSAPRDTGLAFLKALTLVLVSLPGILLAIGLAQDTLGAKPLTEVIHRTGDWSIRLLFVSLLITPLRQSLGAHRLVSLRRIIGVAAFAYIAVHVFFYAADEMFDLAKVAREIVLRIYLTIGFVGVVLLGLLAATSNDAMVRKLGGKRWKRLHRATYLIGVIAVAHFFMQSKLDVTEPTVMAGLFFWLMLYRAVEWRAGRTVAASLWGMTLFAALAGLFTAFGEAGYYAAFSGVDPALVLGANLTMQAGLRPAWMVLLISLCVPALAAGWRGAKRLRGRIAAPA